jgi:hypothetical protein
MKILIVAALVALQSEPAPDPARTLTLRQALTLAPDRLAAKLLGESGALFSETLVESMDGGLTGFGLIGFATRPRSAGPGLCQSDVVLVYFRPAGPETADAADRPMRIGGLESSTRFKIVGDTEEFDTDEDADSRRDAICAQAGPALPSINDTGRPYFFGGLVHVSEAFFAARVLQRVSRENAAGALANLACQEDEGIQGSCRDARATLAMLKPKQIGGVEIERCDGTKANQCVIAHYPLPAGWPTDTRSLTVRIRTDAGKINPDQEIRILSVEIRNTHILSSGL